VLASLVEHTFFFGGEGAKAMEVDLVEDAIHLGAKGVP
jgi:hypothetical protein